jgi:hypothetical protein
MEKEVLNSFKNINFSNIYAIGDIHGDIIPLIVCLRDCCQVIKKKTNFNFDQNQFDTDINVEMSKEWNDSTFKDDLNYEWIGGNSAVVFCGDLLDNVRGPIEKKPQEYPMEEARIFKFINALNKKAMLKGGRIFKVLGNHDMYNLNGVTKDKLSSYVSRYAINYEGYKQGATDRLDYFYKGNPGAKLIGEDGAYLFLMLKDFIFVHGGISSSLLNVKNIEKTNISLMEFINNNKNTIFDSETASIENQLTFSDDKDGLVHDRFFGFKDDFSEKEVCSILYNKFKILCNDLKQKMSNNNYCDPNKMKLVIGHCNQNKSTSDRDKIFKASFANLSKENKTNNFTFAQEFNSPVYKGEPSKNTSIYGITVSCGDRDQNTNMNYNNPSIFRIDVGMSRGFNKGSFSKEKIYSRTPQVLKIQYINNEAKISIIKSTYDNTIKHLYSYLNIEDLPNNFDIYRQKYLKYKMKYLNLKNKN